MTILETAEATQKIYLKIHREDEFRMKCICNIDSPIKNIMKAYCLKARVASIRFKFDGVRIFGNDTPLALGLEDGDIIDAYIA